MPEMWASRQSGSVAVKAESSGASGAGEWASRNATLQRVVDVQRALQWVGQWSMAMIEAAEIRAVDWRAWKDARRDRQQHMTRV
jgi:hypothetical protein